MDKEQFKNMYLDGNSICDLSKIYNISVGKAYRILKSCGVVYRGARKYRIDTDIFSTYTQNSCYWAGFIAADGNVFKYTLKIALKKDDVGHLKKFLDFAKADYKIKEMKKYVSVSINSKKIVGDLKARFNIIPRKSLILQPPINLPKNMLKHYLRGYFDGDGSVYWSSNIRACFISGSPYIMKWFKNVIFNSLEIDKNVWKNKKKNEYRISLYGSKAVRMLNWMYNGSAIYLDRKANRYRELLNLRTDKIGGHSQFENKVIKLLKSGLNVSEIANMLKIKTTACYYIIYKYNERINKYKKEFRNKRDLEIFQYVENGNNMLKTLIKFDISQKQYYSIVNHAKKGFLSQKKKDMRNERNKLIKNMYYDENVSVAEISRRFKVSRATCRRAIMGDINV
jgi:Mor family transcriptional regulator